MFAMLGATDLLAINLEILHASISGFAVRGYSGDLEFRASLGQVLRSKIEVHMERRHREESAGNQSLSIAPR
jgi:hypothetical protein